MENNLINENKSINLNNRQKFKKYEVNYKNLIVKKKEIIKKWKIKAYFYQKNKINILSIIFVLFIIFIHISFSKKISRNLNSINEIILIVKGLSQYQTILTNDIKKPNKIKVNEEEFDDGLNLSFYLSEPQNTIILSWDTLLTSCESMFMNFDYILSIDLSNFNSSKVTNMQYMFSGCVGLKTIKFGNLDTSSVIYMNNMFFNCRSLTSLDLSNFITSSVTTMRNMFNNCTSLVSVDLSSFNTSLLTDMDNMFSKDYSLISLDLSNFDTSSLTTLKKTFGYCKSLIYVNLISFVNNKFDSSNFDNIFVGAYENIISCVDEEKSSIIANYMKSSDYINDCDNICFTKSRKIIIEKMKCRWL